MSVNKVSWALYFLFVAAMLSMNWHAEIFSYGGQHGWIKLLIWIVYLAFLMFSIYCSVKGNIFRTIGKVTDYFWGKQIGLDLYIGVFLSMLIIYLNESFIAVAIWLIPTLLFANLSILLYFGIHFDAIVSKFVF